MDTKFQMKHIQIICRYLEALVIYLPYCVVDKPNHSSSPPIEPLSHPLGSLEVSLAGFGLELSLAIYIN